MMTMMMMKLVSCNACVKEFVELSCGGSALVSVSVTNALTTALTTALKLVLTMIWTLIWMMLVCGLCVCDYRDDDDVAGVVELMMTMMMMIYCERKLSFYAR